MSEANTAPTTELTREQLNAQIEQLKAKLALVRQSDLNEFSVALSETVQDTDDKGKVKRDASGHPLMKPGKGGFKVAGLGSRFPITLYPEQWEIVFANREAIQACYTNPVNKAKSDALRKA